MMRKIISLILICSMLFIVGACGKTQPAINSDLDLSSAGNKFYTHMANGNYQKAIDLYFEKMAGNYVTENEAWEICDRYFKYAVESFADGTLNEDEANIELNKAKKVAVGCSIAYEDSYEMAFYTLSSSKAQYELGITAFNSGNYETAIEYFNSVAGNDCNYEDAQAKIAESREQIKTTIITEAQTIFETGNIDAALKKLESGMDILGGDLDIKAKLDEYAVKQKEKIKTDALSQAQQSFDDGNTSAAIQQLQDALEALDGDVDIQIKIDEYSSAFADKAIADAKAVFLTPAEDWENALNIIKSAQQVLPDNEKLDNAEDYYTTFQPVSLFEVETSTTTSSYKLESATDNMNNYYQKCMTYSHYGNTNNYYTGADESKKMSATYLLNKEYNTLSFTVAVEKGTEDEPCYMTIEIYGDDILLYEAGNLKKSTEPITESLDVTGISQLKVLLKYDGPTGNTTYVHQGTTRDVIFANPVLQKTVE